jgi:hypothetical protein
LKSAVSFIAAFWRAIVSGFVVLAVYLAVVFGVTTVAGFFIGRWAICVPVILIILPVMLAWASDKIKKERWLAEDRLKKG